MKKTVLKISTMLIFISIFPVPAVFAQNVQIDKRLEKGYKLEYLQRMQENSPITLDLLNFELDYGWFVADESITPKSDDFGYLYYRDKETGEKTSTLVKEIDINNLNIAEFYYEKSANASTYYKIAKSDIIIGFLSLRELAKKYNEVKGLSYE